jgi:hypothetical protein
MKSNDGNSNTTATDDTWQHRGGKNCMQPIEEEKKE